MTNGQKLVIVFASFFGTFMIPFFEPVQFTIPIIDLPIHGFGIMVALVCGSEPTWPWTKQKKMA